MNLRRRRIAGVITVLVLAMVHASRADSLRLPLDGYFHPGRAMPVAWNISAPAGADFSITLTASGSITSTVATAIPHGVFPWLVVGETARDISWHTPGESGADFSSPLHPLGNSDRLVGAALTDDSIARGLFADRSVVVIHLDPADPVAGPAMAWQTLDALVLTPQELERIPLQKRQSLFAMGVMLAITGDAAPDQTMPWTHAGKLWIATSGVPLPAVVNPDAYAPTTAWIGGRSSAFRMRSVIFGVLICIGVCGVGLWRSRWTTMAIATFCAACSVAIALDNTRHSPIARATGFVNLSGSASPLRDEWTYLLSHRTVEFSLPIDGFVEPFFNEADQAARQQLAMKCDQAGEPIVLTGMLEADSPLAVMTRRIGTTMITSQGPITSPLRALCSKSIYPGFFVAGQARGESSDWPAILIQRIAP